MPDGRWALAVVQGPGELGILDNASNLRPRLLRPEGPVTNSRSSDRGAACTLREADTVYECTRY